MTMESEFEQFRKNYLKKLAIKFNLGTREMNGLKLIFFYGYISCVERFKIDDKELENEIKEFMKCQQ